VNKRLPSRLGEISTVLSSDSPERSMQMTYGRWQGKRCAKSRMENRKWKMENGKGKEKQRFRTYISFPFLFLTLAGSCAKKWDFLSP